MPPPLPGRRLQATDSPRGTGVVGVKKKVVALMGALVLTVGVAGISYAGKSKPGLGS